MSDKNQSKREGVLAAGNWIVDHIKVIDTYPDQDALSFIHEDSKSNGGGPYNLLKDLVNLGAEFPLRGAGLVGDDNDGEWIINDCNNNGIDASALVKTNLANTSYTDAMTVKSTGRRTFFIMKEQMLCWLKRIWTFRKTKKSFFIWVTSSYLSPWIRFRRTVKLEPKPF